MAEMVGNYTECPTEYSVLLLNSELRVHNYQIHFSFYYCLSKKCHLYIRVNSINCTLSIKPRHLVTNIWKVV